MKIRFYLSFLITIISFNTHSQIIEEKKEGDLIVKKYLNSDLEIIKIEKFKDDFIVDSYEYLPGGKIKNGKFIKADVFYNYNGNILKNDLSSGVYENGKIKDGNIYYETTIDDISEIRYYGNLNISDFKLKGNVELYYDYTRKTDLSYNDKKAKVLAKLNFDENGLLDGKQFYNDKKFNYYLEYKNGKPLKYQKKENEVFVDSITFDDDIKKNVTYLLDHSVYNRQQPKLIFNPFNCFIRLNDECYNDTKEYESNYESFPNSGYTNDLKKILLPYHTKNNCNDRKIINEGINVVFELNDVNFIEKISKSDYSFLPIAFQKKLPQNDICSIEYLFISEALLGRDGYKILPNNISGDSSKIEQDNMYYIHHNFVSDNKSEHSILTYLLFNLTTTGLNISYGSVSYDIRDGYSQSITENLNLFKNINYYINNDLFYSIDFNNNDLLEIKKTSDLEERHSKVFNYFNKLSSNIIDKLPDELLVINENEINEINKLQEKRERFYQIKKGKPDKEKIVNFFKSIMNVSTSKEEKSPNGNDFQNDAIKTTEENTYNTQNSETSKKNVDIIEKIDPAMIGYWNDGYDKINGTLLISQDEVKFSGGPFQETFSIKIEKNIMKLYFDSIEAKFETETNNSKCKKLVGICYLENNFLMLEGFDDECGQLPKGKFKLNKD